MSNIEFMGEGGQQVLDMGGRAGGIRGSNGRLPLPTKFVEQINFQEIEEREVANKNLALRLYERMINQTQKVLFATQWLVIYELSLLSYPQFLGKGSFGVVIRGFWRGQDVAVKIFHKDNEQEAFKVISKKMINPRNY